MPTFQITAIIEAADEADARAVADQVATAICPDAVSATFDTDHRCPRGWITMLTELDAADTAEWAGQLNR
jgi:hypothetical protein